MATFGHSAGKRESSASVVYESPYIKLGEGERIVRILDRKETEYWRYWIEVNVGGKKDGRSITVASKKDSPIAKYFDAIGYGNPGYRGIANRKLINVLDRTPVKKTSKGLPIYPDSKGVFPATSGDENISANPVSPNNKIYIMEFGPQFLDQLVMLHERVRDQKTFDPLPVWRFDIKIISKGKGTDVTRMVLPDDQSPLENLFTEEEFKSLRKYDLNQLTKPMPPEMQQKLLDGEDYNEVIKELGWERPVPTLPVELDTDLF